MATLPIIWINFDQVSLVGPIANMIVELIFAIAFWLSTATALAGEGMHLTATTER